MGAGPLEFYVRGSDVRDLQREFGLREVDGADANLVMRVPNDIWPFRPGDRIVPSVVLAVDLIDRRDGRSVRAGRALLRSAQVAPE